MTQAASSRNASRSRVPFAVIRDARSGNIEAMTLIQRHYEPYIRRLATVHVRGMSYLNTNLYDRLKTRLIISTLKFRL
jgi:hypothetical protein